MVSRCRARPRAPGWRARSSAARRLAPHAGRAGRGVARRISGAIGGDAEGGRGTLALGARQPQDALEVQPGGREDPGSRGAAGGDGQQQVFGFGA